MVKDRHPLFGVFPYSKSAILIPFCLLGLFLAWGGPVRQALAQEGLKIKAGTAQENICLNTLARGDQGWPVPLQGPPGRLQTGNRFSPGTGFKTRTGLPDLLEPREDFFTGGGLPGGCETSLLTGDGLFSRGGTSLSREEALKSSLHRRLSLKFSQTETPGLNSIGIEPEIRSWLGAGPPDSKIEVRPSSLWLGLWLDLEPGLNPSPHTAWWEDSQTQIPGHGSRWPSPPGIGLSGRTGDLSFRTRLSLGMSAYDRAGQGRGGWVYPVRTGLGPESGGQGSIFSERPPSGPGEPSLFGLSTFGQISWAGFSLGGGLKLSSGSQEGWSREDEHSQAWSMLIFAAYEVILGKVVVRPELVWSERFTPGPGLDPEKSVGMGLFTRLEW